MKNKNKQNNRRNKAIRDISYLLDIFPPQFDPYTKIAERLNAKGSTSLRGKSYNYTNVYQTVKLARRYDVNVHLELELLRNEYLAELAKVSEVEKQNSKLLQLTA